VIARMVISQDDAGTPRDVVMDTSRKERVKQSGQIARLGRPQDTPTDWEGEFPKERIASRIAGSMAVQGMDEMT